MTNLLRRLSRGACFHLRRSVFLLYAPFHRLDSPRRATRRNRPAASTYEPRTAADLWNNGEGHNPIVTCSGTLNPLSSLGSLECLVGTRSWRKKSWSMSNMSTSTDPYRGRTVIAESNGLASDDRKVLYGHSSTLIYCEEKKAGNNGKHWESGAPHPRRSDCQLFDSYYYSWVRVSATAELTKSTLNSCAM